VAHSHADDSAFAQFPPVDVPLGYGQLGRPPVLVMAAGYSRMLFAVMIASRQAADLSRNYADARRPPASWTASPFRLPTAGQRAPRHSRVVGIGRAMRTSA